MIGVAISVAFSVSDAVPLTPVGTVSPGETRQRPVSMETKELCSPNLYVQAPAGSQTDRNVAAGTLKTFGDVPICVVVSPRSENLNQLEEAQLQLLIAEHPSKLSWGVPELLPRLGDSRSYLWLRVENQSKYDVSSLRVTLQGDDSHSLAPQQAQVFMRPDAPDAVFTEKKGVSLEAGKVVFAVAASPRELKRALLGMSKDQCLYDVSARARESDDAGYAEALNSLQSGISTSTASYPIALAISYVDLFGKAKQYSVVAFLRVANTSSSQVFYPSRKRFDQVVCLQVD